MKAVEIKKGSKAKLTPEDEYDKFCKKKFSLELSGCEFLALIAVSGNAFGGGFSESLAKFYEDNCCHIDQLKCGGDLSASVDEFECHDLEFN